MTPERFDFYDNQQNWLGTAPRTEVHAKGYWHRSFHCWIVRDEGAQRMVLFQRRRDIKDTFPSTTTLQPQVTSLLANSFMKQVEN
ncbi:hypothetical protein [Paenibacillus sp. DCT19]|uniref:hypothetical protein n=1 Tax=Paenibacillus sp. DCT19 TaxID=2211212 RepID=UPI0034A0AB9B